jgi:hypothetical protein
VKVVVFGWLPRDIYPAKPPYFGGRHTWVYLRKFRISKLDEKVFDKILKKVDSEFMADAYKFVIYDDYGNFRPIYFRLVSGDEE